MEDRIPTVCARELAVAVRRVRERAGHERSYLARALRCSLGTISRLESGKRVWPETQVALLLGVCGVVGAEADEVLRLRREAHLHTWLRTHRDRSPNILDTLIRQDSIAATITEYEPLTVPSLLHTADYTRAVLQQIARIPGDAIEPWVQANLRRQAIFAQRQQPAFQFYVSEQILRRPVADIRVMNDQLQQMVLASALPTCVIRVIPADYSDLAVGPFRLMEYADYNPVVYVPNLTTSLFLEEPDDVHAYRAVLAGLHEVALDAHQSQHLLQRVADDFDMQTQLPAEDSELPGDPGFGEGTGGTEHAPRSFRRVVTSRPLPAGCAVAPDERGDTRVRMWSRG